MAKVSLRNLNKVFLDSVTRKEVTAVSNLSLEIEDGEFLVLVGPSGCGKSTVLRIVAGLEEATSGDVLIGEEAVNGLSPRDRNIAMVFQSYALYPQKTVYENLAFGLRLRSMPGFLSRLTNPAAARTAREEIDRRVRETAKLLEIEPLLDRLPRALSGGQRQRVALGRAIVRSPKVFLMDEPLSNLDAKLRTQTRAELVKLHRRLGITTIYVTHDQAEAMTMGQRIAVMKDGLLQQCDTPLTLYHEPVNKFVAGFLGTPAMNFLAVTLKENGVLDAGDFKLEIPPQRAAALSSYIDKTLTLGIRPEDIFDKTMSPANLVGENSLTATVDVIELMGAISILFLSIGGQALVAAIDADTAAKEGTPLEIVIDTAKVLFFDEENGLRINC